MRARVRRLDRCVNSGFRNHQNRKSLRKSGADGADSPAMEEQRALEQLRRLEIETPSWGYGNSGTRFHVYPWPGAARTVHERIADAALVHRLTGACPSVAIHTPWDRVDDWDELRRSAEAQGIRIGAVNPNLFQDHA